MADLNKNLYGDYGWMNKRDYYETRYSALKSERSSFDAHWQDLSDWVSPKRTRFNISDRNRGERRSQKIIDSTARFAQRTLEAGMHAGMTSPARPWFKLTTPDPDMAKIPSVRQWLHTVRQKMLAEFFKSNIYGAFPTLYGDCGLFGTGAMAILEDEKDHFRCYNYPVGSYVLGTSRRGIVNEFMTEYAMTVGQIIEEFGGEGGMPAVRGQMIDWGRISTTVKNLWDKGQYEALVEVLWVVGPNRQYNPNRVDAKDRLPVTSCHFERHGATQDTSKAILKESGFYEFPVVAPRWSVTGGDSYGTDCPGMIALGDTRMLQVQQKEKGKGIAKQVNPPLVGPPQLRTQKTTLITGEINFLEETAAAKLRPVHEVALNLRDMQQDLAATQYRIRRAYYEDLFLMLQEMDQFSGGQKTAREIEERSQEKMIVLGPVLEHMNDEAHDPTINIVYGIMERLGLIPEVPEALDGVDTPIEYTSILAQAMKLAGVNAQDRVVQTALAVAEVFPAVQHKINIFRVFDNYGEMLGTDPEILISDDDANAALDQANQAAQAAQQAETAKTAAQAAQAASQAPLTAVNGETALSALVGA